MIICLGKFKISIHSQRIESRNTKVLDGPRNYECHEGYRTCTRYDYENSRAKKEEIMCKFRLEDSKLDDYSDPRVFSDWLADVECYFDC